MVSGVVVLVGLFVAIVVVASRVVRRRRPVDGDDEPGSVRRRPGGVGPGAAGAVYDFLNEDKRRALELIVEQRAEETDPERATGDLPSLAGGAERLRKLSREHLDRRPKRE